MQITVSYGASGFTREFADGSTVRDILTDSTVRARLRMPENVTATVDGRILDPNDTVNAGDEVLFEKVAAQKAA